MCRILWTILLCGLVPEMATSQEQLPFSNGDFNLGGSFDAPQELEVFAELEPVDARTVDVKVTVRLPEHHYIYSANTPFGLKTKISLTNADGFEHAGDMTPDRKPKVVVDSVIKETMEKFYESVTWTQRIRKKSGTLQAGLKITGELEGQYCSDEDGTCLPIRPARRFEASLPADFVAAAGTETGSNTATQSTASIRVIPKMRLPAGTAPPVTFTISLSPEVPMGGEDVTLKVRADITEPYHTYSVSQDPEVLGVLPTEIQLEQIVGLQEVGTDWEASPAPLQKKSTLDDGILEWHKGSVTWTRRFVMTGETASVAGLITFQACDDTSCLPVATAAFTVRSNSNSGSNAIADVDAADTSSEDSATSFGEDPAKAGMLPFIISAISAGFLALLTPCVFPMIPITVSYFLKQGEENPGSTLKLAFIYCAGIVGAFTILGLLMAVLLGPSALNQLASNPYINLGFAGIFTIFALMLMGMFELRLPSWLLTWSSKNQETGGVVGVLFMALTFTLVSFTCTFAFVGTLLVVASRGDFLMPIIGMVAFSTAFASPFFLLALFPGFLKKMPKSGGWMNSVKVTLGLVELALVTKFLSIADTGFSESGTPLYLDYHLVMGSWIAVAVVTSMYLLNVFRMPHDSPADTVGPLRCLFSIGFFGLAAYIAVGLFSAQAPEGVLWKQIVAFAPAQINVSESESGFSVEHDGLEYSLDFDAAVAEASKSNRLMFLDFTGVNCQNCRLMEQGVLSTPEVHSVIEDLVRVQLYVDEIPGVKSQPEVHDKLLKRNHGLQDSWFGNTGIPAYVIATPDGQEILSKYLGLDSSGKEFQKFLSVGLEKWQQRQASAGSSSAALTNVSYSTK